MPFYDHASYSLERSVGFLTNAVSALVNAELDARLTSELGLSMAQWRVLTLLRAGTADNASSLCAEMLHDSGAMTRLLDKLEALALVVRQPDELDRRTHRLQLTRKGRQVSDRGFELARDNLNFALADLTRPQGEQLISLLQIVKQTLVARKKGH